MENTSFDFYRNVIKITTDIKVYKIMLRSMKMERQALIDGAAPAAVRSVSYDQERVQGSAYKMTDMFLLDRINELTKLISITDRIIRQKQQALLNIKQIGMHIVKKLEERNKPDLTLKIFIASYIDGKSSELIADEFGYSIKRIWNIKSEINELARSI